MHITVDGTDDPDWKYNIGFVPTIVKEKATKGDDMTYCIVCGPPIMIKFTQPVLTELGYTEEQIIMSLENRMKCGIGLCGHCNIGKELVCKDGPVFSLKELNRTPREYSFILPYCASNEQRIDNKMVNNSSPRRGGITADMTVLDAVAGWKETQAVFQRYDALAGECICCNALFETIEEMAQKYGLDLDGLLADLEVVVMKET